MSDHTLTPAARDRTIADAAIAWNDTRWAVHMNIWDGIDTAADHDAMRHAEDDLIKAVRENR